MTGLSQIAAQMNQPEEKISFIAEALMKPGDYDYRCEFSKPIFRQGLTSINSITPGVVMTGNYYYHVKFQYSCNSFH